MESPLTLSTTCFRLSEHSDLPGVLQGTARNLKTKDYLE